MSRSGAPASGGVQRSLLPLRGPRLHAPGGAEVRLGLLVPLVVVLDMVVQQLGFAEGFVAARGPALEGVVVQVDGEHGWRLVLHHSVHWRRGHGRVSSWRHVSGVM